MPSAPGDGAGHVDLALVPGGAGPDASPQHSPADVQVGHHRAILCEHDPAAIAHFEALVEQLGWEIVAECDNGANALELVRIVRPDLAVVSIEVPGIAGTDLVMRMREAHPQTRLVLVAQDDSGIADARRLGLYGGIRRGDLVREGAELLRRLGTFLDDPDAALLDRRTMDRRRMQDWMKVFRERRGGIDRRGP